MIILGLNAYHADASACLIRDGKLVAAAEEERFRRVKHWAGFPIEAARWCLRDAGIALSDVEHVAINQDSRAARWRKLGFVLTHRDPRVHRPRRATLAFRNCGLPHGSAQEKGARDGPSSRAIIVLNVDV